MLSVMPVLVSAAGALCSLRASRWKCGPCFSCQGCAVAVDVRPMHSSLTAASSRERGGRTCRGAWRGRAMSVPEHPKHKMRIPGRVYTRTSARKYQQQFHGQQKQFQQNVPDRVLPHHRPIRARNTQGMLLPCPRQPKCSVTAAESMATAQPPQPAFCAWRSRPTSTLLHAR